LRKADVSCNFFNKQMALPFAFFLGGILNANNFITFVAL